MKVVEIIVSLITKINSQRTNVKFNALIRNLFAHVRIWMTKMKPESDGDEIEWPLPKMSS